MTNSFSTKATLASGRSLIMDAVPPTGMTLTSLVLTGNLPVEWEIYVDCLELSTSMAMGTVSLTTSTSGGSLSASTTVYVLVTAVDAGGLESPPSIVASKKTGSGSTNKITASWAAVTDAVAYRVYTATKSGMETLYTEVGTTTCDITTMPVNASLGVPTAPDIHIIATEGVHPVPVLGVPLYARLVVFATVTSGGAVALSCIGE